MTTGRITKIISHVFTWRRGLNGFHGFLTRDVSTNIVEASAVVVMPVRDDDLLDAAVVAAQRLLQAGDVLRNGGFSRVDQDAPGTRVFSTDTGQNGMTSRAIRSKEQHRG